MLISVVIPVHAGQNRAVFAACLQSIAATQPPPHEVVLVSDGPPVAVPPVAGLNLLTVSTGVQSGPSVARNLGASVASGELVCFIDSDIEVPPGVFGQVAEQFAAKPWLSALFGSYDNRPAARNFLSQYRNLLHHFVHQTSGLEATTFWSGCGVVRRRAFWQVGGFDEVGFPGPSIEDIDLGYRLKNEGHRIQLIKSIQVKHLKNWQLVPMLKVDFFDRAIPWTKLLLREKSMVNDLNLKVKDRLSVVLVFLLVLAVVLAYLHLYFLLLLPLLLSFFLLLNYPLYNFYQKEKGWWFALRVIPWQCIFYFLNGLAFLSGLTQHYLTKDYERP